MTTVRLDRLDLDKLTFQNLKVVNGKPQHGKYLNLSYAGKRFAIEIEGCRAPFGISRSKEFPSLLSIGLSIDDADQQADWQDIENHIVDKLVLHSKDLFGQHIANPSQMREFIYTSPFSQKDDYAPILTVKVPTAKESDEVLVPMFDSDMKPLHYDTNTIEHNFPKQKRVKVLVSVGSLYFPTPKSCKLMVRLERLQLLDDASNALPEFQFTDSDLPTDEELEHVYTDNAIDKM